MQNINMLLSLYMLFSLVMFKNISFVALGLALFKYNCTSTSWPTCCSLTNPTGGGGASVSKSCLLVDIGVLPLKYIQRMES